MAEVSQAVRSYAKGVDQAPRKVALVASLVRGRSVADAIVILNHTPRRPALAVRKAIESAAANAVNNHGVDGKTLVIKTLSVTAGVRLKRFKPASRGRALPFQKKTSNILVEVVGDIKPKKTPAKAAEVKEVSAESAPKAEAVKKTPAKKPAAKPAKKEETK